MAKKIEKHNNGHEVILDVLGEAITKLKKERMKGEFYIGSVVDGMVAESQLQSPIVDSLVPAAGSGMATDSVIAGASQTPELLHALHLPDKRH